MKTKETASRIFLDGARMMFIIRDKSNGKYHHKSCFKTFPMVIWNANGLSKHRLEKELFLIKNYVCLLLVSGGHFTHKSCFKIQNFKLYHTMHPDGNVHGAMIMLAKI